MANELSWYALHVRSRHEFQVYDRLTKTGTEAFLPVVKRLNRWKDRKKFINFPLFSGYLFIHIADNHEERLSVLKTKAVVRLLGTAGRPEPVPEEQILSLKRLADNKASLDPYPYLKEGRRVRIRRGPLTGVEGILIEKTGQHILVLSVDIIQQGAGLKIEASEVEAV